MKSFYHFFTKKSSFWLFLAIFLFFATPAQSKIPNDPILQKDLWYQINAQQAWDFSTGSKDVVVAVIDVGIDTDHEDLKNNLWKNIYEIPGNNIDDDHNGYVDDIYGWNFIENNNKIKPSVIKRSVKPENRDDPIHHGTLIAGLIGAVGNNNMYGAGLNWNVKIMGIRAMDNDGSGYTLTVAEAVDYAVNNGADVINMSFVGSDNDPILKKSMRRAYDRGVVVVAAAGNSGIDGKGDLDMFPQYPICYDKGDYENWVIGVSSVSRSDTMSVFADYGGCIDIVSIGENVASTMIYSPSYGYFEKFGGGWMGTSFAAPTVAGTAALIKAIRPHWSAQDIINDILYTADDVTVNNLFYKGMMGSGRLNVGKALSTAYSSEKTKERPIKELHYLSPKGLSFYEIASKQVGTLVGVDKKQVKNLSVGSMLGGNDREVVMIIQYGTVYYAKIVKSDGVLWKEVPIMNKKNFVPIKSEIYGDGKSISLFVEWYNKKSNITELLKYDLLKSISKPEKLHSLKGKIGAWSLGKNSNFFIATTKNKVLKIKEFSFNGKNLSSWSGLRDVVDIDDLKIENIFGGKRNQVVAIFYRGNKKNSWQIILDIPSKSFMLSNLHSKKTYSPWKLFLGDFNNDGLIDIWRYKLSGGSFPVYSLANTKVDVIEVPVLERREK